MRSKRTAGLPASCMWRSTMPPISVSASAPSTRVSSPISSTQAIHSRRSSMAIAGYTSRPGSMRIGFHLTPFWSPTDRTPTQILDEAIEVIAAAATMGFDWVSIGQHWISYPTIWPQPLPFLARIAPETGPMQLKTSVLLVPLLNAVELAENIATLDHLCHGRLVVGVAVGYREEELTAAGLTRRDRGPKLEESVEVLKRLW